MERKEILDSISPNGRSIVLTAGTFDALTAADCGTEGCEGKTEPWNGVKTNGEDLEICEPCWALQASLDGASIADHSAYAGDLTAEG